MAKRRARARERATTTSEYRDAEGNVLVLRDSLSSKTIRTLALSTGGDARLVDDAWRRRNEMLFERLTVSWEISGLPLTDQKMLLGRLRMADSETQLWVRQTIAEHIERKLPELLLRTQS